MTAETDPGDLDARLESYLRDAHAIEAQAIKLLENALFLPSRTHCSSATTGA